jgi:prepilin-type N-terminal cleavage/methylation domain-containing protein
VGEDLVDEDLRPGIDEADGLHGTTAATGGTCISSPDRRQSIRSWAGDPLPDYWGQTGMPVREKQCRRAFSLIELVIVVVIIGILAAIAIPRLSRGTDGAAETALKGDLAVMRGAIDLYTTEHVGSHPTLAAFESQMTRYSDISGGTSTNKGGAFIYGPYLRALPPLPGGDNIGETGVKAPPADGVGPFGWVYDQMSGTIRANVDPSDVDASGKPYNEY